jgi:hypothetical protein
LVGCPERTRKRRAAIRDPKIFQWSRKMSDNKAALEADAEAAGLLADLAKRYRLAGRTKGDLFTILASVASTAAVGMANILDMADPDHPDCPLCRACEHINATAHNVIDEARDEAKGRGVH